MKTVQTLLLTLACGLALTRPAAAQAPADTTRPVPMQAPVQQTQPVQQVEQRVEPRVDYRSNPASSLSGDFNYDAYERGMILVGAGVVWQKDVLPVMAFGEYGITNNLGVEARFWYGSNRKNNVRYEDGFLGLGVNYHLMGGNQRYVSSEDRRKVDTYVGALFGSVLDEKKFGLYGQGGVRYAFARKLGAFANVNVGLVGTRGVNLGFGLVYRVR